MTKTAGYSFVEHPADIKLLAWGKALEDVYLQSAFGMMEYLYGPEALAQDPTEQEGLQVKADDQEALLVNWLAELLFLSNSRYRIYTQFRILNLSQTTISAEAGSSSAAAIDDIKAVTYHGLQLARQNGRWEAAVVFDV